MGQKFGGKTGISFGIDRLINEPEFQKQLHGKRVGLVAHPASVAEDLTHSIDALKTIPGIQLTCAFGPQHGMKGDKQYNMIETEDEIKYLAKVTGLDTVLKMSDLGMLVAFCENVIRLDRGIKYE